MSKEETLIIRIEPELKQALKELADKDRRTLSDYLHLQLEKLVAKHKK